MSSISSQYKPQFCECKVEKLLEFRGHESPTYSSIFKRMVKYFMNHLLKIFLKIKHGILSGICEEQVLPTKFEFMKSLRTRDALFSVQAFLNVARA